MSRLQQKPILHGRDHLPGHPDPIPGLSTGTGSFFGTVVEISDLLAYWRLGETAAPWLDTSGVGAIAADLTQQGSGTAPTPDVTGALPAGQDDGALEFNYDGTSSSGGRYAISTAGTGRKNFDLAGDMSVAVWAKVKASAITRRGLIIGTSSWPVSSGHQYGWGIQVIYPGRTVRFTRGQSGGVSTPELYAETPAGVVAGEWNFFVGTYDSATTRLYVNGVLVASTADPNYSHTAVDHIIQVGNAPNSTGSFVPAWFYGTADEAAVWTHALTQDEVDLLYLSGLAGAPDGSQVLISDGHGGFHWGQANGDAIEDASIVNRHVAAAADIAPTKLQHPGGTSSFLRADGTWATPPDTTGNVASDTLWDAKGDLAAATGADAASKVTVGTDGQVLTADSTASTGVKWATPTSGSPSADTQVWMPLTTTVGTDDVLVFDANHQLIPTLTPI